MNDPVPFGPDNPKLIDRSRTALASNEHTSFGWAVGTIPISDCLERVCDLFVLDVSATFVAVIKSGQMVTHFALALSSPPLTVASQGWLFTLGKVPC